MSEKLKLRDMYKEHYAINDKNVPPIYQNSLFVKSNTEQLIEHKGVDSSFMYSRGNNPTVNLLEKQLAALENGEDAKCFGSGMAAISSAILSVVNQGDHVICLQNLYSNTEDLLTDYLAEYGVETTLIDINLNPDLESYVKPNTTMIYMETASSFLFEIIDIASVTQLARQKGIVTLIDNTWATPMFFKPIDYGVDIVLHSLSKYLSGHSDVVGGVVVGSKKHIERIKKQEAALFGGRMSPFEAYLVLRGLKTLEIRMNAHQDASLNIARALEKHEKVRSVLHPGLESFPQKDLVEKQFKGCSGLFGIILDANSDGTRRFINNIKYFQIGVSWGGFESLALPYYAVLSDLYYDFDGESEDITSSFVRLSIGLEDENDLLNDLMNALDKL